MNAILHELRRRNVLRALAIYAAAAWLLVQVATQVFPFFDVPNQAVRWIVVALLIGLPVVGIVSWFYELTPDGFRRESELGPGARPRPVFDLRILAGIGTLLVILLTAIAWRSISQDTATSERALAVMPFKNLSADADSAWFADGVQDEILTRLSRIDSLKVIARGSSGDYNSRPDDLRKVARELGVSHIVVGSVQRRGDSARVAVQLIAADSGFNVWAETYDRQIGDIFKVESEVATAIAAALQARLSGSEQQALAQVPTLNQKAYDAYLRAIAYNPRWSDPEHLARMEAGLTQAVQLDPAFALAWARLARVDAYRAYNGIDLAQQPCLRAYRALDQASRLAPELGETDLARGSVRLLCDGDSAAAAQAFDRARLRLPNSAEVLQWQGEIALRAGDIAGLLADLQAAAVLDPRNPQLLSTLAKHLGTDRQFAEAVAVADRVLNLTPDVTSMLGLQIQIAQAQGALDTAQTLIDAQRPNPAVYEIFGASMAQLIYRGRYGEASTALEAALAGDLSGLGFVAADYYLLLATAATAAGQPDAARRAFQRGHELLKRHDSIGLADLSAGGEYIRAMLCLFEVGLDKAALEGEDCRRLRDIAATANSQFSLAALETLAQANVMAGKNADAIAALTLLLQKPYGSSRYTVPLTPALLQKDPLWAPLRREPAFQKLIAGS